MVYFKRIFIILLFALFLFIPTCFADNLTVNSYNSIKTFIDNSGYSDYLIYNNNYFCVFNNISTRYYTESTGSWLFVRCDNMSQSANIYHCTSNGTIVADGTGYFNNGAMYGTDYSYLVESSVDIFLPNSR